MALDFTRPHRRPRGMMLTPLIDVVFLLLIFFMISTSFVKTESMELSLPGGNAPGAEDTNLLRVYVNGDGRLLLNNEPIEEKALNQRLQEIFKKEPARRAVILSAQDVSVQRLVAVMDMIYLGGGRNLSVVEWR